MRFLPLLEKFECQFFLECDPRIHRIVKINFPYIQLIERASEINLGNFDYHIPFGDLLSIFHKKIADVSHPYISMPLGEKVEKIQQKFFVINMNRLKSCYVDNCLILYPLFPIQYNPQSHAPHQIRLRPLSYTHLTLPTSDLV